MKIRIDQDGCIECGACQNACSKVFIVKSGEKASIVEKYQTKGPAEGEVFDELNDCVQEAVVSCPVEVISVI